MNLSKNDEQWSSMNGLEKQAEGLGGGAGEGGRRPPRFANNMKQNDLQNHPGLVGRGGAARGGRGMRGGRGGSPPPPLANNSNNNMGEDDER